MAKPSKKKAVPPDEAASRLAAMCGLSLVSCRRAVAASDGDADAALKALIEAEKVGVASLDPDVVSDELFGLAVSRRPDAQRRVPFPSTGKPMSRMFQRAFKRIRAQAAADAAARMPDLRTLGANAKSLARVERRQKSLAATPIVLRRPPLPPLTLQLRNWSGTDTLKALAGRRKLKVRIDRPPGDDDDDRKPVPIAGAAVAAYEHLKRDEAGIADQLFEAVLEYVNGELIDERGWGIRPIDDARAIRRQMRIDSIHLLPVAKRKLAYVGVFFHCDWDPEHAGGAVLHGSRVITIGDNEASGDVYAAIKDGGSPIAPWRF